VTALRLDFEYGHSIDLVWQALTDRQLHREWWIPTDLMPLEGGVFRAFPPAGLAGFGGPFDMDVLTVDVPVKLIMRWHGEESHFQVSWQLTPTSRGCRLRVTQQGFFGISGDERREQLRGSYELLFAERLPVVLDRLAALNPEPPSVAVPWARPSGTAKVPQAARVESHAGRWRSLVRRTSTRLRRVARIPSTSRVTMLSVLGVLILTVLGVTALTTLLLRPAVLPAGAVDAARVPGEGRQPGTVPQSVPARNPSPRVDGSPSPATSLPGSPAPQPAGPSPQAGAERPGVSARFAVSRRFELGYIGSITVQAADRDVAGWSVRLQLPPGATVSSAWDQMAVTGSGQTVVIAPMTAHRMLRAGKSFTFAFQVNLGTGTGNGLPVSCAVDGSPCAGP
jgi:uncharacterized protein YndB with AHSA1/START domain